MDWHAVVGILAGCIQFFVTIPYIFAIVRGTTRPNVVSWFLWTLTVCIAASAQISAGASWSLWLLIGSGMGCLAVLCMCAIGYGYKKFGFVEAASLFFALGALVLWWMTSSPVVAIVCTIVADGVAYIPTMVKVYREPVSEVSFYWETQSGADVLALISSTKIDAANMLFPISFALLNGMVAAIIRIQKYRRAKVVF